MNPAPALVFMTASIAVAGCSQPNPNPAPIAYSVEVPTTRNAYSPQIVYRGTKAFDMRVASFKVTPETASALVAETETAGWNVSWQACVIDDWYLFTRPYKYKRIDLAGIYVNGVTGKVERRDSELSLLGDNSLVGTLKSFPSDMPTSVSEARRYR